MVRKIVKRKTTDRIFVFGELMGGKYPHSEVESTRGEMEPVQEGVKM
jgi:hypothetical protein